MGLGRYTQRGLTLLCGLELPVAAGQVEHIGGGVSAAHLEQVHG